jgi:hypothetical protein
MRLVWRSIVVTVAAPCHSGAARRAEPGTHDRANPIERVFFPTKPSRGFRVLRYAKPRNDDGRR